MKAPAFWAADDWRARLLSPLGALYAGATARRLRRPGARVPGLITICVGNLTAGGSGKTPVALALADRPALRGRPLAFLTRGYGGREPGPMRVDLERHGPGDVGDEALLLAARAECWVARDRLVGARAARSAGAEIVILDDGLQNPALDYDLRLCVVDGGFGFGNGRAIPAGPLRETVEAGLARVDALIMVGEDRTGVAQRADAPPVHGAESVVAPPADPGPYFAFAGVGRPEKVFGSWQAAGIALTGQRGFPDHHAYGARDLSALREAAGGARLACTRKDAVKLPAGADVTVIEAALSWRDPAALDALLARATRQNAPVGTTLTNS